MAALISEITPGMVRAGVRAIGLCEGEVEQAVKEIFVAMLEQWWTEVSPNFQKFISEERS